MESPAPPPSGAARAWLPPSGAPFKDSIGLMRSSTGCRKHTRSTQEQCVSALNLLKITKCTGWFYANNTAITLEKMRKTHVGDNGNTIQSTYR